MQISIKFDNKPFLFSAPKEIISCYASNKLKQAFELMETKLAKGCYLAGFLSYEAGAYLEKKLSLQRAHDFPLVYMGCYDSPLPAGDIFSPGEFEVKNLIPSIAFKDYSKKIERIKSLILSGDIYQVTYCIKMKFDFKGDDKALFSLLRKEHPMPYSAYLKTDKFRILSLSPEMFIKKKGEFLYTKPMKGTWPRGNNFFTDLYARIRFQFDKKNRAENLMITDLLRNDLGRIGKNIKVRKLFEVAPYKTLFQMTSSITADVKNEIPLYDLFKAVFPSGSVTGAPKIRAMEVIRELEGEERKIYTGAIGYITPSRDMFFNVPIRTLLLEGDKGEMGVGGGIIWDSTAEGEWFEGMLKSKFLFDTSKVEKK